MNSVSARLRSVIAEALAQVKAHTLPSVAIRFGLDTGTEQEAFSGKVRYVLKRLERFPDDELLKIAKKVVGSYPTDDLVGVLEKVEQEVLLISEITRRDLASALNEFRLGGSKDLNQLLGKYWPEYVTGRATAELFASMMRTRNTTSPPKPPSNAEILELAGFNRSSQSKVFEFLADVLHPIRRAAEGQAAIIAKLNPILLRDGYHIVNAGAVSGYPVYKVARASVAEGQPADSLISEALSSFDEEGVFHGWRKALERRKADPEGAITAAKTLLESVCKHILDEVGEEYGTNDDLPKLYNAAAEQLQLAPSQHTETLFKAILGNCQSVVGHIAGIRNKLGDSHGQGKRPVRPAPRHAELVVNLAGSVAMFLISTLAARPKNP